MEHITLAGWEFRVDTEATREHTMRNSLDHCLCPYCRNFYDTVDIAQPRLRQVLGGFGIFLDGPSEVMPLEHNLILACYRVHGQILRRGMQLYVDAVPLYPEEGEDGTFCLWAGPIDLPWLREEDPEDVISPANQPEFLERMAKKWMELSQSDILSS